MISGCRKWRVCAVCAVVCSGSVRRWTAETDWRNLPSSCAGTLLVGRLLVAPSVLRVWWWAQKSAVASGREEGICSASHVLMADGASDQTNGWGPSSLCIFPSSVTLARDSAAGLFAAWPLIAAVSSGPDPRSLSHSFAMPVCA